MGQIMNNIIDSGQYIIKKQQIIIKEQQEFIENILDELREQYRLTDSIKEDLNVIKIETLNAIKQFKYV